MEGKAASPPIADVAFHPDGSLFSWASTTGFGLCNADPVRTLYLGDQHLSASSKEDASGLASCHWLARSNLGVLVGKSARPHHPRFPPNRTFVWDASAHRAVGELCYPETARVVSAHISRHVIVVLLEDCCFVYRVSDLAPVQRLATRPAAAAAAASSGALWAVASPEMPGTDQVNLVIALPAALSAHGHVRPPAVRSSSAPPSTQNDTIVTVHAYAACARRGVRLVRARVLAGSRHSPLAHMALSASGALLATASHTGTVIRVFDVEAAVCVRQLHRGLGVARVHHLAFSADERWLAASSDTWSIHVYALGAGRLDAPASHPDNDDLPGEGREDLAPSSSFALSGWASKLLSWPSAARDAVMDWGLGQRQRHHAVFTIPPESKGAEGEEGAWHAPDAAGAHCRSRSWVAFPPSASPEREVRLVVVDDSGHWYLTTFDPSVGPPGGGPLHLRLVAHKTWYGGTADFFKLP